MYRTLSLGNTTNVQNCVAILGNESNSDAQNRDKHTMDLKISNSDTTNREYYKHRGYNLWQQLNCWGFK